ncbi:MAG: hypothetical protein ACE5GA_01720 [Candidatus Zixiibacteriota bacterium]
MPADSNRRDQTPRASNAPPDSSKQSQLLADYEVAGWTVRFGATGARIEEMAEMYRSMGLQVLTVPYSEAMCGGCTICFDNEDEPTMMILTRDTTAPPAKSGTGEK